MTKKLPEIKIKPGYVYSSTSPTLLYAEVASGIVVTVHDKATKAGGMCYFVKPIRNNKKQSSPVYACPSIVGLLNMFIENGTKLSSLEANIFGGSENVSCKEYDPQTSKTNIKVAKEILEKKNINIGIIDTGGRSKGRKIAFNTETGELLVAHLHNIDKQLWYPQIQ